MGTNKIETAKEKKKRKGIKKGKIIKQVTD